MSLTKNWKDQTSKLGYFFWLSYQLIFNFVGSFAGWICFYVLLVRAQSKLPDLSGFNLGDFILFLLSLLGLTGHLPQTLYGLVVSIGKFAEAGTARVLGQKVATLVSEKQEAGYYQVDWDASGFSSGIYFYVLQAGDYRDVKKMVLIK